MRERTSSEPGKKPAPSRIIIERVEPEIDGGEFPIKRVPGEEVVVQADVFADGHDRVASTLLVRFADGPFREVPMRHLGNDRWEGAFRVEREGVYRYTVRGRMDPFHTWRDDLAKKREAGQDLRIDLMMGAELLEEAAGRAGGEDARLLTDWASVLKNPAPVEAAYALAQGESLRLLMDRYPDLRAATTWPRELEVSVERRRALYGAWYEIFPRAFGTLRDCERLLPQIARLGFDVLYFPPIHPIGRTRRKGRNNSPVAGPEDPGSPWAIGAEEGGHRAVHPQLGTLEDFRRLVAAASEQGLEVAMDLAFQCSPDHPWVKEHPQWFRWRPDGTIQFAENPPKKYEDIVPLNFECEDWRALWEELKDIILYWAEQAGVRIFRVDNPHTKPFRFWQWAIAEVKARYPETLFLAEAFTRPKTMYRLAKLGFSQSYTYFTWRNTRHELTEYLTELTRGPVAEYFRPNFWPNTPDILPEYLQFGGRPAFIVRLVLAATLSPSYGIYGPAFELLENRALPGREEYLDSEKYEIRRWEPTSGRDIRDLVEKINRIRRENPALHSLRNLRFHETDNEYLLFYQKSTAELDNTLLVAVNLDPFHAQSGWVRLDLERLGIRPEEPFLVWDLLSEERYLWQGERNYIRLDPRHLPAHILRVHRHLRREQDFDYFM